ncbi:type I-E CRISPR-associated protein Cas6/Cse3/CasE [Anthocerotibacter panamensis]|uniref:type I-E CRISPR-associated protein Cas6/Cse3/CasE n=1 Tax=Anthocerotibacter panamensis TaxID=2857077 RepID=UPI001C4079DA|nr:type I-E CRISPR-associated protein Cas6/Cse3/CasE [Anthocerotibacter panamensis]
MYLSKLILNEKNSQIYRDLGNAHALHQRIMQGFPDETRSNPRADWNILYRHEPDSHVTLVQSTITPDWNRLPSGYLACNEVKSLALMLDGLNVGKTLRFRLKANPSKRESKTTKLIPLTAYEDQITWLERQGASHGFEVRGVEVMPTPDLYGRKSTSSAPIKIFSILYQGVLEIKKKDTFILGLQQGIGRGRSYGCGLLSLMRL